MEAGFFTKAYPLALDLMSRGQNLSKLIDPKKEAAIFPAAKSRDPESGFPVFKAANGKNVGMIRIVGGTTKDGDLCSYGTRQYSQLLERAYASEGIDAIVIEGDTPGGSVDGTNEFGMSISGNPKPTVVFADNMLASAGVWWGVHADEIFANANNPTEIGSIGTLFVYPNYANVIEAGNFPNVKIIRAPQSKDKAKVNMFEPLSEEQEKAILKDLKNITEDFKSTVMAGRGKRLKTGNEDIFTGKMYPAEEALTMGLIDAIGTRQEAIDRAGELAEENRNVSGTAVSVKSNKIMKFKLLSALFGGKAVGEANEELSAEEQAELTAAEGKLTEREKKITELEAQVGVLTEEKTALEATIAANEAKIAEHEATITAHVATIAAQKVELEKDPAGQATTVIADKKESEGGDKNPYETSIDREAAELKKLQGDQE